MSLRIRPRSTRRPARQSWLVTYEQVQPVNWSLLMNSNEQLGEAYRRCCTSVARVGEARVRETAISRIRRAATQASHGDRSWNLLYVIPTVESRGNRQSSLDKGTKTCRLRICWSSGEVTLAADSMCQPCGCSYTYLQV